jgi:excisionase family DNA binding protein
VAEELAVSVAQVRVLVRSGELRAIQVGGRNQWRVEASALEEYIQEQYARTRARIEAEQS